MPGHLRGCNRVGCTRMGCTRVDLTGLSPTYDLSWSQARFYGLSKVHPFGEMVLQRELESLCAWRTTAINLNRREPVAPGVHGNRVICTRLPLLSVDTVPLNSPSCSRGGHIQWQRQAQAPWVHGLFVLSRPWWSGPLTHLLRLLALLSQICFLLGGQGRQLPLHPGPCHHSHLSAGLASLPSPLPA